MSTKQQKELVQKARQGNQEAFIKLAKEGIRLSLSVAEKERKEEKDLHRLIGVGFSGWLIALEKYDLSKNYKFSTYSTWWIRGAIREKLTGIPISKQAKRERLQADRHQVKKSAGIKIIDGKGILTTGSVMRIMKNYLKIIDISWKQFWEKLIIAHVRIVFLLALKDFHEEKISLNQISAIATSLYYNNKEWSPWNFDLSNSNLGSALMSASELAYYHWRKDKNPQIMKSYKRILKTVKDYYQKNRTFLESSIEMSKNRLM